MDPKQTVQAFVDAINAQDWSRLDAVVAPDFVRHSIAAGDPPVRSRADLVEFLRREFEIFPDAEEIILDIFAEAEKVAVRHYFCGGVVKTRFCLELCPAVLSPWRGRAERQGWLPRRAEETKFTCFRSSYLMGITLVICGRPKIRPFMWAHWTPNQTSGTPRGLSARR